MQLYCVRHGESEGNALDLHQYAHVPLSARGQQEARNLADRLRTLPIDGIVSSTLTRARETAAIVGCALHKPVVESALFVEIKRPSVIEGRPSNHPDVVAIKNTIVHHWPDPGWRHSDEETFFDLRARAIQALRFIAERSAENLLIVTHGQFLRLLVCVMAIGPELQPDVFIHLQTFLTMGNCGVTRCVYEKHQWRLVTWNDLGTLQ